MMPFWKRKDQIKESVADESVGECVTKSVVIIINKNE